MSASNTSVANTPFPSRALSWRSLLFVPATQTKFVAKAHTRGADAIILDLEDAIAPDQKEAARTALPEAAGRIAAHGVPICVRVNRPLELAIADLEAASIPEVSVLMLPKVMGPEHVMLLDEAVTAFEHARGLPAGGLRFIAVIETAAALAHLRAIAAASPRVAAMGLGNEDLSAELQAEPSADALYPFAMEVVAACRAEGITPFGTVGPFADFADLAGFRDGLRYSRRLGFASAACIHPTQVAVVNEEYGVSDADADRAERLIAAFEAALAEGLGAVAFEGMMVDLPVAERARALLARAGRSTTR
ncbi:MAG: CoA ester lyase [Pseudomonadota bacterium]